MRWTGIIVVLFLIWHLADLTLAARFNPDYVPRRGLRERRRSCQPTRRWRSSTSSPTSPSASTCSTAPGACSSRWAGTTPASTRGGATSPLPSPRSIVVGNVSFPDRRARRRRRVELGAETPPMSNAVPQLDAKIPDGPDRREVGQLQVRREAGEPGQQAQVRGHRRRHRPGRCVRRRHARRARATTSRRSRSTTRPAGPTRSPPRAASTPPRTTRATATRVHRLFYDTVKGGDFRAREATCTASPRCRSTSSTRWSPRACRSPASTAACSTTAPSAAPR